jgi:hypothetical protein
MESITNIQAGNGQWDKCIMVSSEKKTVVIKVGDDRLLQMLMHGLQTVTTKRAASKLSSHVSLNPRLLSTVSLLSLALSPKEFTTSPTTQTKSPKSPWREGDNMQQRPIASVTTSTANSLPIVSSRPTPAVRNSTATAGSIATLSTTSLKTMSSLNPSPKPSAPPRPRPERCNSLGPAPTPSARPLSWGFDAGASTIAIPHANPCPAASPTRPAASPTLPAASPNPSRVGSPFPPRPNLNPTPHANPSATPTPNPAATPTPNPAASPTRPAASPNSSRVGPPLPPRPNPNPTPHANPSAAPNFSTFTAYPNHTAVVPPRVVPDRGAPSPILTRPMTATKARDLRPAFSSSPRIDPVVFLLQMWAGVTIKIMHSGATAGTATEEPRILYLRTSVAKVDGRISHILFKQIAFRAPPTRKQAVADILERGLLTPVLPEDYTLGMVSAEDRAFLEAVLFNKGGALYLCWENPRYLLQHRSDQAIDMGSIKGGIKTGSGNRDRCIMIASENKTLVVKADDDGLFKVLRDGLWIIAVIKARGSSSVDVGPDVESSYIQPTVSTLSTCSMREFPVKGRFRAVACPGVGLLATQCMRA